MDDKPNQLVEQKTDNTAQPTSYSKFIYAGLGLVILLACLMPASGSAQALAYPLVILGFMAGCDFLRRSIVGSRDTSNLIVKIFMIMGGLGVGIVIFFICSFSALFVAISKSPETVSCG